MNREDGRVALEELRRGEGRRFGDPAEAVRWLSTPDGCPQSAPSYSQPGSSTDFYEDDEPVADIRAAFDAAAEKDKTVPPREVK